MLNKGVVEKPEKISEPWEVEFADTLNEVLLTRTLIQIVRAKSQG